MNDQKTADIMVQRAIAEMRSEWQTLVCLSLALKDEQVKEFSAGLAAAVKVGADSIERKIKAIRHQASLGYSEDEIASQGQEKVLGGYIKSRKQENYGSFVIIKWQIPGSQRELVQQQERRVKELLGLVTSEQFFDWWLAQLQNVTDEEIIESAKGDENHTRTE